MFLKNPTLDLARKKMILEYDALYLKIQSCEKLSKLHKELLEKELKLFKRSVNFLNNNKRYFDEKRAYLMRSSNISRDQMLPLDPDEKKIFTKEYEPIESVKKLKNYIGKNR